MRAVYKYEINVRNGYQTIWVPEAFKPLHVGLQNGKLFLWAETTTTDGSMHDCDISVVGTGVPMKWGGVYIGTVEEGSLIWHVFKKRVVSNDI